MATLYLFQFVIISLCVHIFSIFTYFVYYYELFDFFNEIKEEYDLLIVGAGTAGSLIAHRLATETNYSFLVLEAGGRGHTFHDIPVFGSLLQGSVFDWHYETVPQDNACLAMTNSKCKQPRGKILGGSSKLNYMVHVRGNTSHYVDWFHGKYTIDYIEEQFNYIEKNIFSLNSLQYDSQFSDTIMKAARELGYKGLNGDSGIGFTKSILTQKQGQRWTTSHNIIESKHVITNVLVDKLILMGKKCVGIEINSPKRIKIFAKKGVIVSAGTFNSAKLLQLSGIGPADLLTSVNISLLKELPVGKNLQDHIGTGLDLVLFDKPQSLGIYDMLNIFNIYDYFMHGKGPLTTPACEVSAFVSTNNEPSPNLQIMAMPVGITTDKGSKLRKSIGITDEVWYNYFSKVLDKHAVSLFPLILHPKSKGEVRIKSNDPNLQPIIDPKYFSHADDVKILVDGVKIVKNLIKTNAMKALGAHLNNIPFPGCENLDFFSDTYLECYVKHLTLTSYHPVGTCSMGTSDSPYSVVDTSFKVIGIDNLYVVDGSVLPTLPSGNINAAIAMMANIFFENTIKQSDLRLKKLYCNKVTYQELIFGICPIRKH